MATAEEIKIRITAQDSASQVIKNTNREMQTLSRTATSTGVTTTRFGGNLSVMGRTAGQAGIQVQQLVGQIQGGTNPMLALSQQAADLGFVLGAPLVGAVVALGASLAMNLVPALFESAKSTADLVKEIDKLRERTGLLTEEQRALIDQNFAEEAEKQRKAVEALKKERESLLISYAQQQFIQERAVKGSGGYIVAGQNMKQIDLDLKRVKGELATAEQKLQLAQQKRTEEGDKFVLSLQKQVDLLGKSRAETLAYEAALLNLNPEQKKQVEALLQQIQIQEAANNLTKAGKSDLDELAESTRITNEEIENYAASGLKKMEDGLIGLIDGSKSASDAFKSMANSIISDLIRMQIRQSITSPIARALGSFIDGSNLSSVNGVPVENLMSRTTADVSVGLPVPSYAGGGYTGFSSRSGGIDGKGGFPAILHPNETVVDHSNGGGGVNVTLNLSTGVSQTVRAEVANMLPQIAAATKAAVADARMRGGSYSSAMGV